MSYSYTYSIFISYFLDCSLKWIFSQPLHLPLEYSECNEKMTIHRVMLGVIGDGSDRRVRVSSYPGWKGQSREWQYRENWECSGVWPALTLATVVLNRLGAPMAAVWAISISTVQGQRSLQIVSSWHLIISMKTYIKGRPGLVGGEIGVQNVEDYES